MSTPRPTTRRQYSTTPTHSHSSKKNQKSPRRKPRAKRIAQKELRVIFSLRALNAHCQELRNDIVERLEHGASVERGDLVVKLDQKESRTITFDRLIESVGEAEATRIRDEIQPSSHSYLKVTHR